MPVRTVKAKKILQKTSISQRNKRRSKVEGTNQLAITNPQIAFISMQTCLAEAIKFEKAFDPVAELSAPARLDSVDSKVDALSEVPIPEQRR
jgi:hypothetical protein